MNCLGCIWMGYQRRELDKLFKDVKAKAISKKKDYGGEDLFLERKKKKG